MDLIYEYVHDKIDYSPIWGSVKGAHATLADGVGNSFDQSSLMIALLRASGYTANYKIGTLRLTQQEVTDWIGVGTADALNTILPSAGIPVTVYLYPDESIAYVDIDHVWVEVEIDGETYVFDPAYKTHTIKDPIDIATAMNYDRASFLAAAKNGATEATDYIQNVNKSNMAAQFKDYAANLIQTIKTGYPDATVKDITGGLVITPVNGIVRQTSLPYENDETIEATWTDIPDSFRTQFTIQYEGINKLLYTDETYGRQHYLRGIERRRIGYGRQRRSRLSSFKCKPGNQFSRT